MSRRAAGRSAAALAGVLVLAAAGVLAVRSGGDEPVRAVAAPAPSAAPTVVPSAAPTVVPSAAPTVVPSAASTVVPSAAPSVTPPPPPPRPVPRRLEVLPAAARPGLDMRTVLGPPPGPRADPRPVRTAPPAARFAVLAGVQDYRPPTIDTIGSVRDVQQIRAQLLAAGWLPQNIVVLTDAQVTGASLRTALAGLAAHSRPGTFGLFHWSGHVKQLGGTTEALWPFDRDFVRDTEVAALLGRAQGRLWVDVAGCEAASFAESLPNERVLFSGSSRGTEKSYEFPPWGMSVWTGVLFDRGLRQGRADADGDGRATVGEALRYGQYQAQAVTEGQVPHGRQTPQFAGAPDLGWTLEAPPA